MLRSTALGVVAALGALGACGRDDAPRPILEEPITGEEVSDGAVIDPGDDGDYRVEVDPARFAGTVDHPYFPMLPGSRWVYEAVAPDGEVEIVTVEVLDETRVVMGVETIVVRDLVTTEDGEVVEDTSDWFAQDTDGNVWYFGEDTVAYDDEGDVSDAGAWEAGVDGALPGIVMPSDPTVSETGYRQEFLAGEAEDMGQVIDVTNGVVVTRDWTPLEPDVVEEKTYLAGVGFVFESKTEGDGAGETVRLVEFSSGR